MAMAGLLLACSESSVMAGVLSAHIEGNSHNHSHGGEIFLSRTKDIQIQP